MTDESYKFFEDGSRWREYMGRVAPGSTSFVYVEVTVPAGPFLEASWWQAQALFGLVARDTWAWLAEQQGWPEPPPAP